MAEDEKPAEPVKDKAYYKAQFAELIKFKKFNQTKGVDWPALFAEWLLTDPGQFQTASSFLESKGGHRMSLQKRGGRTFWNEARQAARMEAIARQIEKAPDKIAARLDNLIRVQGKLEALVDRLADRINRELDIEDAEILAGTANNKSVRQDSISFSARMLDRLKDVQNGLADVSAKLGGNPQAGAPTVNLYQTVIEGLRQRDALNGVIDAEPDRPTG